MLALVQSRGSCLDDMYMLKSLDSGSVIHCAPSLYILPGMLSGPDDLDGSVVQIRSYTSLALNVTSLISTALLNGRNLCRRLLTLIATSLVNTDVKKLLSAFAFSGAADLQSINLIVYVGDSVVASPDVFKPASEWLWIPMEIFCDHVNMEIVISPCKVPNFITQ